MRFFDNINMYSLCRTLILVTIVPVIFFIVGFQDDMVTPVIGTSNETESRTLPETIGARVITPPTIVDINSNESLKLSNFTVSAWLRTFNTDIDNSGQHFIVNKGGSGDESSGFNLNYGIWMDNQQRIRAGFEAPNGTDAHLKSDQRYNDYGWHNTVLRNNITVSNGTMLDLFIDGIKVDGKPFGIKPDNTGNQHVTIGANSLRFKDFFYGDIDKVQIYNKPLTDNQIKTLYNNPDSKYTGQVLYKSFGKLNSTQP